MRDPLAFENLLLNAGWCGEAILAYAAVLLALGLIALIRGVPVSSRWAFTIAGCLPAVIGLLGAVSMWMLAFSTLGTYGMRDSAKLVAAVGEVCAPLLLGLSASAVLMTLAVLVWMRGGRETLPPSAPPPLPSGG
jgi:hypothetical protein